EELLFPDPEQVEDLVVGAVAPSPLFASRFRENAARALLLPRRRPGTRTPLWQQRQRAADLLAVASRYGSFPILVETYRECLSDVFDLPALREILAAIGRREITVHGVETLRASPFASSLLFDYVAAYMYDGDAPTGEWLAAPLASRRAVTVRIAGEDRWIAIEDAARYRDGVGVQPPAGVPEAFLGKTSGALEGLLARWARTHGPFLSPEPAA